MIRGVHPLLLPSILRGGRPEVTLRVGGNGGAQSRQELATGLARDLHVMLAARSLRLSAGAFALRPAAAALLIRAALWRQGVGILGAAGLLEAGELRERQRLRDAAAVLARRAFGGDERLVIAGLGERRLGRDQREAAGEIRARRQQILRPRADAARVAAVAPLDRVAIGVLRLERVESGRRRVSLADGDRQSVGAHAEVQVGWRADLSGLRRDLDDVAALDAEACGRLRMNLHPRAPQHLRHGVGELLEPRLVRTSSVTEDR